MNCPKCHNANVVEYASAMNNAPVITTTSLCPACLWRKTSTRINPRYQAYVTENPKPSPYRKKAPNEPNPTP